MYICIHVYMYTCMYVYMSICIYIYMSMYIYMYICTHIYIEGVETGSGTYMYSNTHVWTYTVCCMCLRCSSYEGFNTIPIWVRIGLRPSLRPFAEDESQRPLHC